YYYNIILHFNLGIAVIYRQNSGMKISLSKLIILVLTLSTMPSQ
ncbi:unnamed protein product, partial [marine sediment metagenome]